MDTGCELLLRPPNQLRGGDQAEVQAQEVAANRPRTVRTAAKCLSKNRLNEPNFVLLRTRKNSKSASK